MILFQYIGLGFEKYDYLIVHVV